MLNLLKKWICKRQREREAEILARYNVVIPESFYLNTHIKMAGVRCPPKDKECWNTDWEKVAYKQDLHNHPSTGKKWKVEKAS